MLLHFPALRSVFSTLISQRIGSPSAAINAAGRLVKDQGWILPAHSEGLCEYDSELKLTTVAVDKVLLHDVGLEATDMRLQRVGLIDPLLLQFALAFQAISKADRLYRQTMEQAFAAHLGQTLLPQRSEVMEIDDARLRQAVEFIPDHLAQDITLDDLAGVAAMSPFHFARAFKAATGTSPLQYVIAARIDLAGVKLRNTGLLHRSRMTWVMRTSAASAITSKRAWG